MKRVNYLNNKDILKEIHKSKSTFCSFVDPAYAQYDIILPSVDKINIRTVAEAKRNKAKRLTLADYEAKKAQGIKVKQSECEVEYTKMIKEELIFRVMTYDHIPEEPGRKKNPKTIADLIETARIVVEDVQEYGDSLFKAYYKNLIDYNKEYYGLTDEKFLFINATSMCNSQGIY